MTPIRYRKGSKPESLLIRADWVSQVFRNLVKNDHQVAGRILGPSIAASELLGVLPDMTSDQDMPNLNLSLTRSRYLQGFIDRETYWLEIQRCLKATGELAEIIDKNEMHLKLCAGKLVLEVQIQPGANICFVVDWDDVRSAPVQLIANGNYEVMETKLLLTLAAKSRTFVDVGANVGYFSLSVAKSSSNIDVISIEPNPSVFELLKANIELSQLNSRIDANNHGCGRIDEEGVPLVVPAMTGTAGGSFRNQHPLEQIKAIYHTQVRTLDEVTRGRRIDLLKVDVEGAELQVILGGAGCIHEFQPTI